jgi:hypothetical protein
MWIVVYVLFAAAVLFLGWLGRHWSQQLKLERERPSEPHATT